MEPPSNAPRSLVVVGLQYGDEGKGKVVDYLARHFDVVVRFQGGTNAGHTIVTGDHTFKLRLLPSGVLQGCTVVIGNGVVVDPQTLREEVEHVRAQGFDVELVISERAHVITPLHIQLDALREAARGTGKVGTTRRGIGPTYSSKSSRWGIRVCDLLAPDARARWDAFVGAVRTQVEGVHSEPLAVDTDEAFRSCRDDLEALRPMVGDSGRFVHTALSEGRRVLFEGAQGTLLDIDHGTYPYVTSSNCVAAAAATGTGVGPLFVSRVLGVLKAYMTRVGMGPFPTETNGTQADRIRERGHEYGTVTGRPRRCGWLDLVALRYAVRVNGVRYLAVTKADVLSGMETIPVCVSYELDGEELTDFPADPAVLSRVRPVYTELPGWSLEEWCADTTATDYTVLPPELRGFVRYVEECVGARTALLSVGPGRSATVRVPGVFEEATPHA